MLVKDQVKALCPSMYYNEISHVENEHCVGDCVSWAWEPVVIEVHLKFLNVRMLKHACRGVWLT